MKEYRLNEGDIRVPKDWRDRTVNAFVLPQADGGGSATSFVVTRDTETQSATVEHYADLQLVEAAKKLGRYKLIERCRTQISGESAMQVDYTWVTPERIAVWQRQAYVQYADYFLIFTLTTP